MPALPTFSQRLLAWSRGDDRTLGGLVGAFSRQSFVVLTLMLLVIPATPLPTGGVTHLFELVAILLAFEMLAGRQRVWLPKRWLRLSAGALTRSRNFGRLIGWLEWAERHAGPALPRLFGSPRFTPLAGLIILVFSLGALLAPWFSGLDTLPSLGVVLVSLGIILESLWIFALGLLAGSAGLALLAVLGGAILRLF